jgi:hypothetical protein
MKPIKTLLLLVLLFVFYNCTEQVTFDVLIKNGQILDGSGSASYTGDIGINADTITAIGDLKNAKGLQEIDATGLAVAPGFINMLSWATESLIEDGRSMSDIKQGVTLEVFGEGWSMGPLNEQMKSDAQKDQGDIKYDVKWTTLNEYLEHLVNKGISPNGFSIVWHSPDRFNYIGCFHPYWHSDGDDKDRTPDTWYKGNISPFQQTAHHQNTAITLFNIPEKDPWLKTPTMEEWAFKWAWRDGHADGLIKRGMLRYPKSVDEKVEVNGWIFLREGETYIGIKPLKDFYTQDNLLGRGLDGFNIVKSDHAQTGFIFEMGTKEEFGSFEKFRKKLPENKLAIDWAEMSVRYTNSKGIELHIQYNAGLPVDPDGLARSVPSVWIDDKMDITFDQWPMVESPWVNMEKSVLNIQEGNTKILVDWKGEYPVINRRNL